MFRFAAESVSRRIAWLGCFALAVSIGADAARGQESEAKGDSGASQVPDFARDVFPVLQKNCLQCHGPEEQEGDLRMDQADVLLTEDFVVPGDAEDSRLYETMISVDDDRMPPEDEGITVSESDIAIVRSWIDGGAKWSDISQLLVEQNSESAVSTDAQSSDDSGSGDPAQVTSQTAIEPNKPSLSPRAEYWITVWRAFGDLHPAAAHFPVALLIIGGLCAIFGMFGSYRCSDFAFGCLWLGALFALATSGIGWSYAWNEGHREDPFLFEMDARLFWHRWTGVLLSILAFLVAVWATISRRRDPENGHGWKLALLLLACLTMYVGHAGGDLTHPRGYKRLYELFGWQATKVQPKANVPVLKSESPQ